MIKLEKCVPYRAGTYSEFTSSENRCKHVGVNPNRANVRQFLVDGGIYRSGTDEMRCDYLLINDDDKRAYYIELKGSDLIKATEQIDATVKDLHSNLSGYKAYKRIIYRTGTHKVRDHRVIMWQKKNGNMAVIKERLLTETI